MLLSLALAQAVSPEPLRLEFQSVNVPVVDLSVGEVVDQRPLHLPTKIEPYVRPETVVDGWYFSLIGRNRLGEFATDAYEGWCHWRRGRAVLLTATQVVTGIRRDWALPALTHAERREREAYVAEHGGDIEEFYGDHWLDTHDPRVVRLSGDRFLLSESSYGSRHSVELSADGRLRVRHDLVPGVPWTPASDGDSEDAWWGIEYSGTSFIDASTGQVTRREFEPFSLAPHPGWSAEVIGNKKVAQRLRSHVFRAGDAWIGVVRTFLAEPRPVMGTPGPGPSGPSTDTLIVLDAKTGAVLRATAATELDDPLHAPLGAYDRELWGNAGVLCGLSHEPADPDGTENGSWSFVVARADDHGGDWTRSRVTVRGLPSTDRYSIKFAGELEPGLALFCCDVWMNEEERTLGWALVRSPAK